jgi:hypothetical protein
MNAPARRWWIVRLVAEAKIADDLPVPGDIVTLQVLQQSTSLSDHFQETPTTVMILGVRTEMVCEIVDPVREQRDLNSRGSGVLVVLSVLFDRRCLFKSHDVYSPRVRRRQFAESVEAQ